MTLKTLLMAGLAFGLAAPACAKMLDPGNPDDAVEIAKRAQCGESDGKPAVYHWSGNIYGRVPGEPDRLLFRGEGMNIRTCTTINDPVRGRGWRQVSREVMLYLDPASGAVLRKWTNPWTGETVDVMQINNDPVNSRPMFARNADGSPAPVPPIRRAGRWLTMPVEVPLFYTNPLAGDYQDYVGGQYHAMEIFDFGFDASEMLDAKAFPTAYPVVSWVRLSEWMPWMKMRGRTGQIVFNAMGNKLKSFDELPPVLKDEIAANYPAYTAPPPVDDTRPNATTWAMFKTWIDTQRKAKAPK